MSQIVIRNVSKVFGDSPQALKLLHAGQSKAQVLAATGCSVGLNQISLTIPAGEVFVIMGLSGSGKSTLVRHLNRLIEPSEGEIEVDGQNILSFSPRQLRQYRRFKVSMVFQGFGLLPHRTVQDNVAYGLLLRGERSASAQASARHWIAQVGLAGQERHYPDELSGGMKQRVGLARALAVDTPIVLMDEAFSALDPLIRAEMQDQLLQLQASLHKTIVFITHDLDEALRLGQRIALLKDGELVQLGTPQDLLLRPANDHVRRFVARRGGRGLEAEREAEGGGADGGSGGGGGGGGGEAAAGFTQAQA